MIMWGKTKVIWEPYDEDDDDDYYRIDIDKRVIPYVDWYHTT